MIWDVHAWPRLAVRHYSLGTISCERAYTLVTVVADHGGRLFVDETQAIQRSQNGESEPFRFLVESHERVLFGTAYLMTRDRGLAEDMVQETFLLAWTSLRSFRTGARFKPWVVKILVNRVMAERRKRSLPEAQAVRAGAALPGTDDPEQDVLSKEERRRVRRAVDTLGQEARDAILLRYYSELSVPEIARALGWREGTVKSRLHRAQNRLRELLDEEPAAEAVQESIRFGRVGDV